MTLPCLTRSSTAKQPSVLSYAVAEARGSTQNLPHTLDPDQAPDS